MYLVTRYRKALETGANEVIMNIDNLEEGYRNQLSEREDSLIANFRKKFVNIMPTDQQMEAFHRTFLEDPMREYLIKQLVNIASMRPNPPIIITPKTSNAST